MFEAPSDKGLFTFYYEHLHPPPATPTMQTPNKPTQDEKTKNQRKVKYLEVRHQKGLKENMA